jgi:hypothetical protein
MADRPGEGERRLKESAVRPNKGMKLTRPGQLRSLAAYPRCSADLTRARQMARFVATTAVALLVAGGCSRDPAKSAVTSKRSGQPAQAEWTPYPAPPLAIGELPEQASLYAVVVKEFVRLGWKTVCIDVMPQVGAKAAVDPPGEVLARLRAHRNFRPGSACRREGEEVIDIASGSKGGVAVTLIGAARDHDDFLVRVQWCCWVGWGSFRVAFTNGAWSLKRTEGWLQT